MLDLNLDIQLKKEKKLMTNLTNLMGIISIVLLVCTIICGLWIKFHPKGNDMRFHFKLSLLAVIISLLTIILFMFKK